MIAAGLLAHGGTPGLIVESATGLAVILLALVIWRSERRARAEEEDESSSPD